GYHQFHAAVLLPAFRRVVGGYRLGLAEAAGHDGTVRNPLLHQVITHRLRPALGELHVVFVAAHAVGMAFHIQVQSGISQHNAGYLRQALARSGQKLKAPSLEQYVRHVGDQAAGRVARGQNRVELGQQTSAKISLVSLRLLAEPVRFFSSLARLFRFHSERALLRFRRAARSIRLLLRSLPSFPLLASFLRRSLRFRSHALGLSFRSFRLGPRRFSIGATPRFRVRQSLRLRLAGRSRSRSLFFRTLLYRHHTRFFRSHDSFTRRTFHRALTLLVGVCGFRSLQLLVGFAQTGAGVLLRRRVARDPERVPGFKQWTRRLLVDAEDGVLNPRLRG